MAQQATQGHTHMSDIVTEVMKQEKEKQKSHKHHHHHHHEHGSGVSFSDDKQKTDPMSLIKGATLVEEEEDDDDNSSADEAELKISISNAKLNAERRSARHRYEAAIIKKTRELFAIEERLYSVRYDPLRTEADILLDVKNFIKEVVRLEATIKVLREKAQSTFEDSLALPELGVAGFNDPQWTPVASLDTSIANIKELDDRELDDLESQKFMRTKSTNTLKEQPPAQKWHSILKMFREWKQQSTIAEGQSVVARTESNPSLVNPEEDIAALRSAIFNLKNRKNLSKSDKALLQKMTQKLKELTQNPHM